MIVEISDQIIKQSGLSAKEILLKVALVLFEEERLTLGQASENFDRDLQTIAKIR